MMASVLRELTGRDLEALLIQRDLRIKVAGSSKRLLYPFFSHGLHNGSIAKGQLFPQRYYRRQKVHLLVRDPKDVVVSHYHHARYRERSFDGSFEDFLAYDYQSEPDTSLSSRHGIDPIINYMNAWIEHRSTFYEFHIQRFEDLKREPVSALRTACAACRLPVDDDLLKRAVEFSHFDNMRRLEESGAFQWWGLRPSDDPRGRKTRFGRVGGGQAFLTPACRERIEVALQRLDATFDCYKPVSSTVKANAA